MNTSFFVLVMAFVIIAVGFGLSLVMQGGRVILTDPGGARIACKHYDTSQCGVSFYDCEDGNTYSCMQNAQYREVK